MQWGWIFAQIIGDRSSTKVTKMMVVLLRLTFFKARSSLPPFAFVWAPYMCMWKMLRITNNFSSEAADPVLLKFYVAPPWGRETKDW